MYTIDEILEKLQITYPDEITISTDIKRTYNVNFYKDFILDDIKKNNLKYNVKERRILLYTTPDGEEIFIQYPGKYSLNRYPFDFRPIARIADSGDSIDLDFQGIWRILDKYIKGHKDFMPIFNNLLFRIGRMINHEIVNQSYSSWFVYNAGETIEAASDVCLALYQFTIHDETLNESLNFHARKIDLGNNVNISLAAFLYYLDSIIQIEDCKYKQNAINDSHGRISTADSLMVIYSYHIQTIDLAEMLQRFVTYRGIARCKTSEYAPASDNTILISATQGRLEKLCDDNNIVYSKKKFIINDTLIPTRMILPQKHIIITNSDIEKDMINILHENNWCHYNIFDYLGDSTKELDNIIINAPYYFDFDYEFNLIKAMHSTLRTTTRKMRQNGVCIIAPYCTFIDKDITILNTTPTQSEIDFLHQKGYSFYVKTDYNSPQEISQLFIEIEEA